MKKEEEGPCRPQGTGQALCIESERRCRERAGRESREGRKKRKERRERRKVAKPMQSRLDLVSISQCILSSSLHLLVLSSLFNLSLSLSLVLNLNVDLGVKFEC